jgi:hypothetical protein
MERLISLINSISTMHAQDLALLSTIGTKTAIKKKANLLIQGNVCKHIHFITNGFFRMYYIDLEGARESVSRLRKRLLKKNQNSFHEK